MSRSYELPNEWAVLFRVQKMVTSDQPGLLVKHFVEYKFRRSESSSVAGQYRPEMKIVLCIATREFQGSNNTPTFKKQELHNFDSPSKMADFIRLECGLRFGQVSEINTDKYPYLRNLVFIKCSVPRPLWLDEIVK